MGTYLEESKRILKDILTYEAEGKYLKAELTKIFLSNEYGVYLVEQAGRVEKLEEYIKDLQEALEDSQLQCKRLEDTVYYLTEERNQIREIATEYKESLESIKESINESFGISKEENRNE